MSFIISGTASHVSGLNAFSLIKSLPDIFALMRHNPLWGGIALIILILMIVGLCGIAAKAEEPWWSQLVPFYNLYVIAKITFGNGWFFLYPLLAVIPVIGGIAVFVITIFQYYRLAKAFGMGLFATLGLIFIPFIMIPFMGFSPTVYYTGVDELFGIRA